MSGPLFFISHNLYCYITTSSKFQITQPFKKCAEKDLLIFLKSACHLHVYYLFALLYNLLYFRLFTIGP